MKRKVFRANTRMLFATCALVIASATVTPNVQAKAVPADWWVYVHNDRAADIKALLAKGSNPNVVYTNGQPALMRAVVDGAWGVFDVLAADRRTDLNATNPANETALMYLAVAGQTDRARQLIARGAQVNRLGWTPLHYAASKGNLELAKLLLANKAMVNAPSPEGTTPIMMAAFSGSMPMVQLLLDAGADITTKNLKGENASDWALQGKQGTLSAKLIPIIASKERQRGGPIAPPHAGEPPAPVPQAAAPDAGARNSSDIDAGQGRTLGGVSGVRLGNYD